MPEEVTDLDLDSLKMLKGLGLKDLGVNEDIFKKINEKQHTPTRDTAANLKIKEESGEKWNFDTINYSEIKSLFEDRFPQSNLIGVYKKINEKLFFFIDLPNKFKKNIPQINYGVLFSPSHYGFSNQFLVEGIINGKIVLRRIVEFNIEDLINNKKFCVVFCSDKKPKVSINYSIYYNSKDEEKEDLDLYNRYKLENLNKNNKLHTLTILDNPAFDPYLNNDDKLRVSWAASYHKYFTHCDLIRKSLQNMSLLYDYFSKQMKNCDEESLPGWTLARETAIECIKAKKTTDIPEVFHKIYSNKKNRKILMSIFYNTKLTTPVNFGGMSYFFNYYLFSEKFSDYGLKMPCLNLTEPYEIESYEIDYNNLPTIQDLGSELDTITSYWRVFFNIINSNQQFNANMYEVLEPHDMPLDIKFYKDTFENIDISDTKKDVENLCISLIEEANASKNWVLNNGSFFAINIGPFIGVQLFEKFEDIEAKFLTKENFYYHLSLNVEMIVTNKDPGLVYALGEEKAHRVLLALQQIVCALVRDFWVIERKESLFEQKKIETYLPRKYNRPDKPFRVVYLPRVVYENKKKNPSKTCYNNLDYAKRSKHAVRAFIRTSDTISPLQKFLAKKYKFDVPEGYTFVQPHYRGETKEQKIIYRSRSAMQMIYEKKVEKNTLQNAYFQFEIDVKKYLEKMKLDVKHYSASRRNDGGIDIIGIKNLKDKQVTYLVQCKCYKPKNKIGPSIVRELAGSMIAYGHECKGIIVTTSKFTPEAVIEKNNFLKQNMDIQFIDGDEFARKT